MSNLNREEIRSKIEKLATLSKDLETQVKLQSKAANIVAAEQYKRKVSELTEQQNVMMNELVSLHPDSATQERFRELQAQVDSYQAQIRSTRSMDELRQLESQLDQVINEFVHHFQKTVADLMGAPPPAGPVFT